MSGFPNQGGIAVQLLGGMDVRRNGATCSELLAQPKRLALLAYLLLRRTDGFVRRSELLTVFWPESPEEKARASLRQALRFLRIQLGEGVIVGRGDAEVGVQRTLISCDAHRLAGCFERADDARAVAEYSGDLMPGFLMPSLSDFMDWLDAERRRLRERTVQAALRLADRSEQRGDTDVALTYLRRALELDASNEAAARKLSALSHAHARLSRHRVLVIQLANRTGDSSLDVLGMLAADTFAQSLANLDDLDVAPAVPLRSSTATGDVLPAEVLSLATRLGAGTVVHGDYLLDGGRLLFRTRISDVTSGKLLPAPDAVSGSPGAPIPAIAQLSDDLVRVLAPILSRRVVHARVASRPPSLAAYRAYADGLDFFVRGEWQTALEYFTRATRLEPEYPLPRLVAAIALWNLGSLHEARAAVEAGMRHIAALTRFERAVLDMVRAWLAGDWAAAYRAARVQADLAPSSIPHFQVAEEARRLNRLEEARAVLQELDPEAGELRGWIYYWIEITSVHHLLGEHQCEVELSSQARRLHPESAVPLLLQARAYAALGRDDLIDQIVDDLLIIPGATRPLPAGAFLHEIALELRAHGYGPAGDRLLSRACAWYDDHLSADSPSVLRRAAAIAYYHSGRYAEARDLFIRLCKEGAPRDLGGAHHGHLQAHLDEGYLAVIAVRTGARAEAERWVRELREMDRPFLYGAQWYWLACVAALEGRVDDVARMLRRAFADGMPLEMHAHTDPHLADMSTVRRVLRHE